MKLINRLLIEAKAIQIGDQQIIHAIVGQVGDSWAAMAYLWDGVQGHPPTVERSTHTTQDAAIDHLHKLGEKYPNSRDVTIIIDDFAG